MPIILMATPAWAQKMNFSFDEVTLAEAQSASVTITLDEPIICIDMDETCKVDIALSASDSDRISINTPNISIPYTGWSGSYNFVVTNIRDENVNTNATETITALIESNSEYYDGFTASMDVNLTDVDSEKLPSASFTGNQSAVNVKPGDQVTINANDFKPNSNVTATLYSTPKNLGTFNSGSNGSFNAVVTIPSGTALGAHTIVLSGANNLGFPTEITLNVNVVGLPATGFSPEMLYCSASLICVGLVLSVLSRKKREPVILASD